METAKTLSIIAIVLSSVSIVLSLHAGHGAKHHGFMGHHYATGMCHNLSHDEIAKIHEEAGVDMSKIHQGKMGAHK